MTLVARLACCGMPLLIGDVLVSSENTPSTDLSIPTTGKAYKAFVQSRDKTTEVLPAPVALTQKVSIIGRNLAIGWSGKRVAAQSLFKLLDSQSEKQPFTSTSLREFVAGLSNVLLEEVQAAGFILDSDCIRHFTIGEKVTRLPARFAEHVALLGTGAVVAEKLLNSLDAVTPLDLPETLNQKDRALALGLTFAGALLAVELKSSKCIEKLFGGGYEILYPWDRFELRKLEEVTYVFHIIEKESAGKWRVCPLQASKNSYVGDHLVIRTIPLKGRYKSHASLTAHVIPPVHRTWSQPPSDWFKRLPSLNSPITCHFFINSTPEDPTIITLIQFRTDGIITFTEHTAALHVSRMVPIVNRLKAELGGDVVFHFPADSAYLERIE